MRPKSELWPVTGSFVTLMPVHLLRNDVTYLARCGSNCFPNHFCPRVLFPPDFKIVHVKYRITETQRIQNNME